MLEGIHILNKTVITEAVMPNETLFSIAGLTFIVMLIFTLAGLVENWDIAGYTAIICLVAFVICLIQVARSKDVPTDRYEYEVTIDESVLFSDIYEKYEVVEQRGEIWVLEDKESED